MKFPGNCPNCNSPVETRMIAVDILINFDWLTFILNTLHIPYFKEVIVMASTCDSCGYKSNEVKGNWLVDDKLQCSRWPNCSTWSENHPQGWKSRGSESRHLEIWNSNCTYSRDRIRFFTWYTRREVWILESFPQECIRFTTVEGLLTGIKDDLLKANPWVVGDSRQPGIKERYAEFIQKLDEVFNLFNLLTSHSCWVLDDLLLWFLMTQA